MKSFGARIPTGLLTIPSSGGKWTGIIILGIFGFSAFLGLLIPLLGFDSGWTILALCLAISLFVGFIVITYSAARTRPWALAVFLAISVFVIEATFRRHEMSDRGFDGQTLLKLCIWGAALLIAFLATRNFFSSMFLGDIKWLTMFSLLGLVSITYSLAPAYTFGTGVAAISYCALAVCVAEHLSKRQILYSLLIGISVVLTLSLAMYVAGWGMTAPEGKSIVRLAGITGSPNGLGRAASLVLLIVAVLVFGYRVPLYSWRCLLPIGLALPCLILSDSRTATIALLAAFGICAIRWRPVLGFIVAAGGSAVALLIFNLDIPWEHLAKSLTRTGRFSEVTTLTGRTEIWYATWNAFLERPLLGYGFGTTKVLIPEVYRNYWGFTVTQAHNFFLQIAVTTGLVGLSLVLMALLRQTVAYFARPQPFPSLVFAYLMIYGVTEAGPLAPGPNILTLFWALSLCWDRVRGDHGDNEILNGIAQRKVII